MLFRSQLGATVDYAILMTSRFQEELKKGLGREEAIRAAAASSDGSIVTSALVLFCATLGVSFVSSIDLIGAICVMLARGALISALVSIFLMPAILCVCEPLFQKTSYRWKTPDPVPAGEALPTGDALPAGETPPAPESAPGAEAVPEALPGAEAEAVPEAEGVSAALAAETASRASS